MVDLTQWSDGQLKALQSGIDKKPEDMTDDELLAHSAYYNNAIPETKPKPASLSLPEAKAMGLSQQQYEQRAKDYIEGQYGGGPRDTALGLNKAFATEAGPGFIANTIGAPGDIESLGRRGLGWLTGADPGTNKLPTSSDIRSKVGKVLEPYTGGLYEPQNRGERYAASLGSFAPYGMTGAGATGAGRTMANIIRNTVAPGLATEGAGEGARALGLPEAPARMVAGVLAPGLARKAMTPNTIGAEQRDALEGLRAQGIPVTAEQALGRTIPSGVPEYTENMLRNHFGVTGRNPRATGETFTRRFNELGRNYEDIANRNTLTVDPPGSPRHINTELTDYMRRMNSPGELEGPALTVVNRSIDRLRDLANSNRGTIPGRDFHREVSSIKQDQRQAAKGGDWQRANALSELTGILESGMERSMRRAGNGADADLWRQTNQQYRNGLALEKAAKPSDSSAALGFLMPERVVNAMDQVHGSRSLTRNPSEMAETSRNAVGMGIGKGPPAPPGFMQNLLEHHLPLASILGAEALGTASGYHGGGLAGAAAGAVLGGIPGATIQALKHSHAGDAYRTNNVLPYNYWGSALPPAVVAKALQEGMNPQDQLNSSNVPALPAR